MDNNYKGMAVGVFELDNLVACFVALDAASKAANVRIQSVERNRLKSGACVKMRGSVSDVNAAMEVALEEQGHRCEITVVTQYEEIAQEAEKLGARFLYNLHPDEGISSSLKIGLRVNREMDACLFTVADQPWLRWETVFGLVDVFLRDGKGIACVEHDGKTGNPCVFSKKYYGELMELSGDVGGKRVVVAHRGDVAVMKVEDGREMVDVDFSDGRR